MAQLKVTQTRSTIGGKQNQRETLATLGLGRIGKSTVQEDTPGVRGMIRVVAHLVSVEEVDES
ncbi:ribosomal protein L30 [Beutenbergia cavernae DSM 12333]|uniref:Large ribosomal subunit protein uL30 n=1 Tax=Beutenbergia cavernae (strain ATCC BAA-8 / DSM 12333 / CCUG 43141 / JCM 11478 / NBRC 16432 / NCIMB 13614 / HKI 0122) TaxID=471853 RepID=RL30_BEUC1|nr:50S ribosomal protein L30 [Beutenbergia cavernae]C5C0H3.1 RecName: Full=Large ribosomal subunit protein uL30; AltName: Full=50S ribosomal protein L30 [Beutenbergia cavernae DSM 12333]ACQ81369.1 ribosomal protein L30 [Beutenbergia cavernae DSM 12333]